MARRALTNLVIFHVGEQAYALPSAAVDRVLPMAALSRPPGLPSIVRGLLNLGGRPVPVLSLSRILGSPDTVLRLYTPLLLLRDGRAATALLVDRVDRVVAVDEGAIHRLEEAERWHDAVDAQVSLATDVVYLLSPHRLLLGEERERLTGRSIQEARRVEELSEVRP